MTDIGVVLLSGLGGALLSAVAALLLAQRQQAKQRRQEKWVRVLNGYHNFYTEGQKYLTFLVLGQYELAKEALQSVYKSAYDVGLLDPFGSERADRMIEAARALPIDSDGSTHEARDAFKRAAEAAYKQFEADKSTARWASKPDRRPRRPF